MGSLTTAPNSSPALQSLLQNVPPYQISGKRNISYGYADVFSRPFNNTALASTLPVPFATRNSSTVVMPIVFSSIGPWRFQSVTVADSGDPLDFVIIEEHSDVALSNTTVFLFPRENALFNRTNAFVWPSLRATPYVDQRITLAFRFLCADRLIPTATIDVVIKASTVPTLNSATQAMMATSQSVSSLTASASSASSMARVSSSVGIVSCVDNMDANGFNLASDSVQSLLPINAFDEDGVDGLLFVLANSIIANLVFVAIFAVVLAIVAVVLHFISGVSLPRVFMYLRAPSTLFPAVVATMPSVVSCVVQFFARRSYATQRQSVSIVASLLVVAGMVWVAFLGIMVRAAVRAHKTIVCELKPEFQLEAGSRAQDSEAATDGESHDALLHQPQNTAVAPLQETLTEKLAKLRSYNRVFFRSHFQWVPREEQVRAVFDHDEEMTGRSPTDASLAKPPLAGEVASPSNKYASQRVISLSLLMNELSEGTAKRAEVPNADRARRQSPAMRKQIEERNREEEAELRRLKKFAMFLQRYSTMFSELRYTWYALFDIGTSIAVSILTSLPVTSKGGCVALSYCNAAISLFTLVVCLVARPYGSYFGFVQLSLMQIVSFVVAILVVVYLTTSEDPVLGAIGFMMMLVSALAALRTIVDVMAIFALLNELRHHLVQGKRSNASSLIGRREALTIDEILLQQRLLSRREMQVRAGFRRIKDLERETVAVALGKECKKSLEEIREENEAYRKEQMAMLSMDIDTKANTLGETVSRRARGDSVRSVAFAGNGGDSAQLFFTPTVEKPVAAAASEQATAEQSPNNLKLQPPAGKPSVGGLGLFSPREGHTSRHFSPREGNASRQIRRSPGGISETAYHVELVDEFDDDEGSDDDANHSIGSSPRNEEGVVALGFSQVLRHARRRFMPQPRLMMKETNKDLSLQLL